MRNTRSRGGNFTDDYGRKFLVMLDARLEPAQLRASGQTVDHEPIPADALEFAVSGETWRANADGTRDGRARDMESGGQNVDDLRRVGTDRARHAADLWDRWHLNGMRSGCAHQAEEWTCTNDLNAKTRKAAAAGALDDLHAAAAELVPVRTCNTRNGWPIVGRNAYPKRGDQCVTCGRNRWDEPTDACPVSGYRYGTAWLYEPIPADALADLRATFGLAEPAAPTGPRSCSACAGKPADSRSDYGHLEYDPQHGTVLVPHVAD